MPVHLSTSRRRRPIQSGILLVAVMVLVPTSCVLWFMSRAMDNERLATQERLAQAHRASLNAASSAFRARWGELTARLEAGARQSPGPVAFAQVIRDSLASSVIFLDDVQRPVYPERYAQSFQDVGNVPDKAWDSAERAEFSQKDYGRAAALYGQLAAGAADPAVSGRALLSQARVLVKAGDTSRAIHLLTGRLQTEGYRDVMDTNNRMIQPTALMLAVQTGSHLDATMIRQAIIRLTGMLNDYDSPIPSPQRLFLMESLVRASQAKETDFPTLGAERLGRDLLRAEALAMGPNLSVPLGVWIQANTTDHDDPSLQSTRLERVWGFPVSDGRVLYLFDQSFIELEFERITADLDLPGAYVLRVTPSASVPSEAVDGIPVGGGLANWSITLGLTDPDWAADLADRQVLVYVWVGSASVVLILVAAVLGLRSVQHQARLARLKNDLVATVSHELKTPIASVKVLVDTLIEDLVQTPEQKKEYLTLIASENDRLGRLVTNFLTFSRLEQRDARYDVTLCEPGEIVEEAVTSQKDRLIDDGFVVDVSIAPDLPAISVDRQALTTAITNLIENAQKFSKEDRQIAISAVLEDQRVCVRVEDHGIGLSRKDARRIFSRFYQADTRLARESGGVGLGLSIVKGVVEDHGGTVRVESEPGKGSLFEFCIPVTQEGAA